MASEKTMTITLRVAPAIKQALRDAAESEHRSLANMVEVLIRDHCRRNEIAIGAARPARAPSKRGPLRG
jgi:hypothetical protein